MDASTETSKKRKSDDASALYDIDPFKYCKENLHLFTQRELRELFTDVSAQYCKKAAEYFTIKPRESYERYTVFGVHYEDFSDNEHVRKSCRKECFIIIMKQLTPEDPANCVDLGLRLHLPSVFYQAKYYKATEHYIYEHDISYFEAEKQVALAKLAAESFGRECSSFYVNPYLVVANDKVERLINGMEVVAMQRKNCDRERREFPTLRIAHFKRMGFALQEYDFK